MCAVGVANTEAMQPLQYGRRSELLYVPRAGTRGGTVPNRTELGRTENESMQSPRSAPMSCATRGPGSQICGVFNNRVACIFKTARERALGGSTADGQFDQCTIRVLS